MIEKTKISSGPSTSPGTDNPKRLTTESPWSTARPRRTAAMMPAGKASASAIVNEVRVSASVYG
jgi:hypothetical protein